MVVRRYLILGDCIFYRSLLAGVLVSIGFEAALSKLKLQALLYFSGKQTTTTDEAVFYCWPIVYAYSCLLALMHKQIVWAERASG